jgi:hypothetical protein
MRGGSIMKNGLTLITIILLLAGCGGNVHQTPEATVEAFFTNVAKLNETSPTAIDQAQKVLKTLFSTEKAYEAFTTTFRNIEVEEFTIGAISADETGARVPVTLRTKGLIGIGKEETKVITFRFEKKDGKWCIKDIAGILEKYEKKPETEKAEEEGSE